jgi:outer membrane immunogenic protein
MRWSAIVGSVALALGASTGAIADGMPRGPAVYEQPFSWTGFYVGVNGGYSWGRADTDLQASLSTRTRVFRAFGLPAQTLISDTTVAGPAFLASGKADVDGWLGGGQIGYNWQSQRWVIGIEADLQATGEDGSLSICSTGACAAGASFATASYKLDWFGTVRGRLGYLVDRRLLLYATGGLAYGHFESDYSAGVVGGPSSTLSDSSTKAGWVLGGGAEWAIDRNWLLRAEYMYMDLGNVGGAAGSTATTTVIQPNIPNQGFTTVIDTTGSASVRTDFTDQIFRVGLSYKFGDRRAYAPLK